jgi:membrane protease YdiL (CAAX protease family)
LVFLAATYAFALNRDSAHAPAHFGLSLGGIFDIEPLRTWRMIGEVVQALAAASLVALFVLPPFWAGFHVWYEPAESFNWDRAVTGESSTGLSFLVDLSLGHLLVVALPEEAFFRGYLQTTVDDRWHGRISLLGARIGPSLLIVSALFALGHFTTTLSLSRLAVFFPSLLFGWLRARTGGVGASIFLHAQCNVFSALLGKGYGLY